METGYRLKTRGQKLHRLFSPRSPLVAATEIGATATTCSRLLVVVVVWMELVASMWLADADSATVEPAERFRSPVSHRRALTGGERHPALAWTSTR